MSKQNTPEPADTGAVAQIWRFFSSVRLALVLMLIIIGLSLIGALVIQAPGGLSSADYETWVEEAAAGKVGAWAPLLSALKLFEVFRSPWFVGAGALLIINILVCSIDRWKAISLKMGGGQVKLANDFYTGGSNRAELGKLTGEAAKVAEVPIAVFRQRGYRVRTETSGGNIYIAADKNRSFRLGTYLSHLSLVLFIIGFLIGNIFGFKVPSFEVAEGTTREVGFNTGLTLKLNSFADEYYPEGMPKDYRSDVVLYKNGQVVEQGTIRVNHPMSYDGIRFYQSNYGPAVTLQVTASDNKTTLFKDTVLLDNSIGSRSAGSFDISQSGMQVFVISPGPNDTMIPRGNLAVEIFHGSSSSPVAMNLVQKGVSREILGMQFTYLGDAKFSGFQVNHDPGNALIWIASTLFVLGISMVLYLPHRQFWALAQTSDKGTRLQIRSTAPRNLGVAEELDSLVKAIKSRLKPGKEAK